MSTPAIVEALRTLTAEIVRSEEFQTALRDVVSKMLATPRPEAVEMRIERHRGSGRARGAARARRRDPRVLGEAPRMRVRSVLVHDTPPHSARRISSASGRDAASHTDSQSFCLSRSRRSRNGLAGAPTRSDLPTGLPMAD